MRCEGERSTRVVSKPAACNQKARAGPAIAPPEIRTVGRPMAVNAFETIDAGILRRAR